MSEQNRWTLFFVFTFVFLFFHYQNLSRRQAAAKAAQAKQQQLQKTPGTQDGESSSSPGAEGGTAPGEASAADAAANSAAAARQLLAQWEAAPRETIRTKSLLVELGAYGGRAESWKVIDSRYSIALRGQPVELLSLDEAKAGGEEMLTDFPAAEFPNAPDVPMRPLELNISGPSTGSLAELNSLDWTISTTKKPSGEVIAEMVSPEIKDGVQVVKRLAFPPEGFAVKLDVEIRNKTDQALRFSRKGQHGLGVLLGPGAGAFAKHSNYLDISNALYYDGRVTVAAPKLDEVVAQSPDLKWVGVQNQYFIQALAAGAPKASGKTLDAARVAIPTAMHPPQGQKFNAKQTTPYRVEGIAPEFLLPAGQSETFSFFLYIGPKSRRALVEAGGVIAQATGGEKPNLQRAVFYYSWDWFRALCLLMTGALDFYHGWVGSWGLAIILLTISVKLLTHPINHRALRATAEFQRQMGEIKPDLDKINEKYADDPMKKYRATQDLYKERGMNPMAPLRGCLPMFLQLPIFVALYRSFSDYIVLRGAPFLWIEDLSAPDRLVPHLIGTWDLNLLPLLMAGTQVLSMRVSSKNMNDPNQKAMMYVMPVFMLLFFYKLPSGLFLYWTMQNVWQIGHAMITNKEVEHEADKQKHGKHEVFHLREHAQGDRKAAKDDASDPAKKMREARGGQPLKMIESAATRRPKPKGAKKGRRP